MYLNNRHDGHRNRTHHVPKNEERHFWQAAAAAFSIGSGLYGMYKGSQDRKEADEKMRAGLSQDAAEATRQAGLQRAAWEKHKRDAGWDPKEKEAYLAQVRTRLGKELKQEREQIGEDVGARNLGRSSLPVQYSAKAAEGMMTEYAGIESDLAMQDARAKERASEGSLLAQQGIYNMERQPRMMALDLYRQERNSAVSRGQAGMKAVGAGMTLAGNTGGGGGGSNTGGGGSSGYGGWNKNQGSFKKPIERVS